MSNSTPTIPPRPTRLQNSETMSPPTIPPRPSGSRNSDRSVSPGRAAFARSPLNDPTFVPGKQRPQSRETPQIRRPPSVSQLPSIGQEGNEYGVNDVEEAEGASAPETSKSVSRDLPLHAPTVSVSPEVAKARVANVTRTESPQHGAALTRVISKEKTPSSSRPISSAGERSRPASIAKDDDEHGIPHIGVHVPMLKYAGDVQAPTPSPQPQHGSTGVGFFNNGGAASHREGRQHTRTKSGRKVFQGPPGSYGLHGHGVTPKDPLEKSWYEKHPNDASKEAKGVYGPKIQDNRKEYHLSQEDLNKLVHHRIAPSRDNAGTPLEEYGYQLSEEYQARNRSAAQVHAESPLHKAELPPAATEMDGAAEGASRAQSLYSANESRESLGLERTKTAEDRWAKEHGYDAPILASDETAKHEFTEFLQPAVSPEMDRERRRSAEFTQGEHGIRKASSRTENRSSASHGLSNLSRFSSREEIEGLHTPLDNVQEYEPLFPEDDEDGVKTQQKKPTAVDKLKRPDLARYHFPSQDVWEDAPSHVHLETTVETPEIEDEIMEGNDAAPAKVFEGPEAEATRKETITEKDQENFLSDHTKKFAKTHLGAAVMADMPTRTGMKQRFPSRDIWEDAPDDVHQYTTVDTPEEELDLQNELTSPVDEPVEPLKPVVPTRPAAGASSEKKVPVVPERPKPQVPARPTRALHREMNDEPALEKTTSAGSTGSAGSTETSAAKQKPQVPARPGGSKLASLKAGFMNDLNSRLQLGPQAPKPKEVNEEEPVEKEPTEPAPLADARKGRAKGPARRRPAASPSGGAASAETTKPTASLSISTLRTTWSLGDDGELNVPDLSIESPAPAATSGLATEIPKSAEKVLDQAASSVKNAANYVAGTVQSAVQSSSDASKDAGAAENAERPTTATSEHGTQTGQMDIRMTSPTGGQEEITTYVGGSAHGEGDIVVDQAGVEHGGSVASPVTSPSKAQAVPAVTKTPEEA